MARVKRSVHSKKRRRVVLERAQGYYGNRSRTFKVANQAVMKAGQYAFRDRRARKGDFRSLWIQRINAACRLNGTSYSQFISGLRVAGVDVDRKSLADLAVHEPQAFASLVELARSAAPGTNGTGSPAEPATTGAAGSGASDLAQPATSGAPGAPEPVAVDAAAGGATA
jgi:large subunit ribosomal protein L20